LLLIGSIVVVAVVNANFQRMALEEAKAKARLIQDRCLAIHAYFARQLKPSLMSRPEMMSDPNYFDPRWMSSTYAIREIHRYFRELNPGQYYYREPAVNARSPENEADPFEKR